MPALTITEPAVVHLRDMSPTALDRAKRFLTFADGDVTHLLNMHRKRFRWKEEDPIGWEAREQELKSQLKRCILFGQDDVPWTYSGLADQLAQPLVCGAPVERHIPLPEAKGMAWEKEPEHEERYYQTESEKALIEATHAAIEMGTGLGKSRILLELAHHFGLQTIVLAPSTSILSQLVADFTHHLGKRYVGQYGDGKRKFDKLITIATFQSLTRLSPEDEAYQVLSKAQVFMVDESHMCPASTLERVCMGVAKNATYRFFVSATQTRGDGTALVLKGITGPIVYSMTVERGVNEGFLARPSFKMARVPSMDDETRWNRYQSIDVQKMTRVHHYYNPLILRKAAQVANMAVQHLGHQVLIQVEEIKQFKHLLYHLEHGPRFAHGAAASDKDMQAMLPKEFWKSDPQALAEAFNREEFPILVGTSCIGVGTDIKVPRTIINLMGGCSPIGIPQAVGRGTRKHTYLNGTKKVSFNFVDFVPILRTAQYNDQPMGDEKEEPSPMYRHGLIRARMYQNLYPNVKWV